MAYLAASWFAAPSWNCGTTVKKSGGAMSGPPSLPLLMALAWPLTTASGGLDRCPTSVLKLTKRAIQMRFVRLADNVGACVLNRRAAVLLKATVCCDWPGCNQCLEFAPSAGALRDHKWEFEKDMVDGPHLCHLHGHQTWEELRERQLVEDA